MGKRAITLAYAFALALALAKTLANTYTYAKPLANAYAFVFAYAYAYPNANANAFVFAYAHSYPNAFANANAFENKARFDALNNFIKYAEWSQKFQVYQEIDFNKVIVELKQLKAEIPDNSQPIEVHLDFGKKIIQFWLKTFDFTSEMINLSKEEIKTLDDYFYGNLLMVQCKDSAVRYSPKIWPSIESRMLLPSTNS